VWGSVFTKKAATLKVLDRGAQADARGAARRASPVIGRGAQAAASLRVACALSWCPGHACCPRSYLIVVPRPLPAAPLVFCASQVLDRGAWAVASLCVAGT
jgi:hypothetical protein